jgi:glycosyltransferase involved in cell wall biosynthesis
VDTARFRPGPKRARRKEFTVGYVGRLAGEKGLALLLDALARLDFPWKSLWIGDGPFAGEARARVREKGWEGRVVFTGALPQDRLVKAYRSMDCLVLPSLTCPWWKEQFGRVLVEAMACGVPCIGSDSGSIPEVLGGKGLIFPEGDAPALAARLVALHRSPALRRKLTGAGLKRAARYSVPAVAKAHWDFYRELARD